MSSEQNIEGKCIIVSAPSGAGKTTIVHRLLSQELGLFFSVSATSRQQRSNETDGEDYYFLSPEEFIERVGQKAFIEWEEVYPGQYYGTLKEEINRIWHAGGHVIFDVDVVGGLNLKKHFGDKALALFISPPSVKVLEERLIARESESPESLRTRVNKAAQEIARAPEFDAKVINDELEQACKEAYSLVSSFLAS